MSDPMTTTPEREAPQLYIPEHSYKQWGESWWDYEQVKHLADQNYQLGFAHGVRFADESLTEKDVLAATPPAAPAQATPATPEDEAVYAQIADRYFTDTAAASDEREAFEVWARSRFTADVNLDRVDNHHHSHAGQYIREYVQGRWEAWQAARAPQAAPQPTAQADAALQWLETNLFERKWGGTLGRPSEWRVRGDHMHTTQRMRGETLMDAIAAAQPSGESKQ